MAMPVLIDCRAIVSCNYGGLTISNLLIVLNCWQQVIITASIPFYANSFL